LDVLEVEGCENMRFEEMSGILQKLEERKNSCGIIG
jgi:hypothetical protein